ncbi:MAG: LytTR family DNA-binding domain-containing protein [Rubrivivax sp.]|nr:LytTR family DNA-binding domain-containing protein [Rubrivivax sp.]
MKPPRALIAEDEPLLATSLRSELALLWPELQVQATVGDGLQAAAQTLALQPDVCFFDIRMPGCTGLEAAQALAEDWPDGASFPLLVFVTAYDDYALQAFEAQAVDYLVKPVDRSRLAGCVARLQAQLMARQAARRAPLQAAQPLPAQGIAPGIEEALAQLRGLLAAGVGAVAQGTGVQPRLAVIQAQAGNLVHLVPVEEVVYFEAADKYVRVITAQREHLIRTSLRELLPQLDAQAFWQVHRGTVVQARCITSARREESGKVTLALRGRPETLVASRLYAHLFKGM